MGGGAGILILAILNKIKNRGKNLGGKNEEKLNKGRKEEIEKKKEEGEREEKD